MRAMGGLPRAVLTLRSPSGYILYVISNATEDVPLTIASAAGKAILLGEHAVVYARPAIAVPVAGVRAEAEVMTLPPGEAGVIIAEDLGHTFALDGEDQADGGHALRITARNTFDQLGIGESERNLRIALRSHIPIARGMGSGAACAAAIVRGIAAHLGYHLTSRAVSDLVYRTEVIHHGTPSGIDNTVVSYEKPVYFVRGRTIDVFWVGTPFSLLIADTGIASKTMDTVRDVRLAWQANPARHESLFDAIGQAVDEAREAISLGDLARVGWLMNHNHRLLQTLGVSCDELDALVEAARSAGAIGAKLSGGGKGGCMIALVSEDVRERVASALLLSGAASVIYTTVQ